MDASSDTGANDSGANDTGANDTGANDTGANDTGAGGTRRAVIEAALRGFGEKGFAGTTTREIAARAGTNIAAISYHFGGKEGLRAACARHVVEALAPVIGGPAAPPADAAAARAALVAMVERLTGFLLTDPGARPLTGFVIREMAAPSEALDTIYEGLFRGVHARLCALWGVATARAAESEAVKLAVFSVMGQIFYFHFARPVVVRRLGWAEVGPAEAAAIGRAVAATLVARLDADAAGGEEAG